MAAATDYFEEYIAQMKRATQAEQRAARFEEEIRYLRGRARELEAAVEKAQSGKWTVDGRTDATGEPFCTCTPTVSVGAPPCPIHPQTIVKSDGRTSE